MKIKTLHIKGHKNLTDARLEHTGDLIAIIGNNGCGKSNLLEAISCIFKNLYRNEKNIPFEFYLEYITSDNIRVEIDKEKSKLSFRVNGATQISINEYLPKKVVAIYSGEENRLWKEYYEPFYKDYISNIQRERHATLPQMLYLDKNYWDIALLCLSLSSENKEFLQQALNINHIDKIKFDFGKANYPSYPNSPALNFVNSIDNKSEYLFDDISENLSIMYSIDEVFIYLYMAHSPHKKLINDITVMFNDGLVIQDLSEGQKKLLLLKAALEFAGQEDTLYLLDEPDAHVHVNNKNKVIDALKPYIHNRQVIVTTHSPTITQCIDEKSLFMMASGSFILKNQQEIIEEVTGEFWNAHQQNSFLASKKDVILLTEGKGDKLHIDNAYSILKDEFPYLNMDTFQVGSASKIHPFMNGLYEAKYDEKKVYIAIYDADKEGKAGFGNFEKLQNKDWRKLKYNSGKEHNNFFALLLPLDIEDGTIENMYDSVKYQEAYQKAVQENLLYFTNKSINKINEDIKEKSKTILAENSSKFTDKEDFKSFRALFDLILQIKNRNLQPSTSEGTSTTTNERQPQAENAEKGNNSQNVVFSLKKADADAKAIYDFNTGEITILSGSKIKLKEIDSFRNHYGKEYAKRNRTLVNTKKREEGNQYILEQDVTLNSLREAILFCTTTNLNSSKSWEDSKGKTLAQYLKDREKIHSK